MFPLASIFEKSLLITHRNMGSNCGIFQLTQFRLTAPKWFTFSVLSLI
jgi:hypothetical protein